MPIIGDWPLLKDAEDRARKMPLGRRAGAGGRMGAAFDACLKEVEADRLLNPVVAYETLPIDQVGEDRILLRQGACFSGVKALANDLAGASAVVAAVATIGPRLEARASRYFANKNMLRALLLEEIGTAALFVLSERLYEHIEEAAYAGDDRLGDPYQPGEGAFPMRHQRLVCALAGAARAGVRLSGAGMMAPVKSMSVLFGIGPEVPRRARLDRCAICQARERCAYRDGCREELAA